MSAPEEHVIRIPLAEIDLADETFCFRMNVLVDDLAEDIRRNGQDFPIVVRRLGDRYQLVCGFRRVTALCRLGADTATAVVRNLTDEQAWRLAYSENEACQSYNDVDRAHAVMKALQAGNSLRDVTAIFDLGKTALHRLKDLAQSPAQAQEHVKSGQLTTRLVVTMNVLSRRYPDYDYDYWLAQTLEKKLKLRELKLRVSRMYDEPRKPAVTTDSEGRYRLRGMTVAPAAMSASERRQLHDELKSLVSALEAEGLE